MLKYKHNNYNFFIKLKNLYNYVFVYVIESPGIYVKVSI